MKEIIEAKVYKTFWVQLLKELQKNNQFAIYTVHFTQPKFL